MNKVARMTMEAYLKAPGMQHSELLHFRRSPAHYKAALENPEEDTWFTKIGQIAHIAIFEPHLFEKSHWLRPETYENEKGIIKAWNGNANICKDWLAAHEDRLVIRSDDLKSVVGMKKAVLEHSECRRILEKGDCELTFFAVDPEHRVILKARPDWTSGNTLVNLKTTEDASPEAFSRSIAVMGYDSGAAFYLDVADMLYDEGKLDKRKEFYLFIVVERNPPYAVNVFELDSDSIELGRQKYRRWLATYALCEETGSWPAYEEKIIPIALPVWAARRDSTQLLLT